MLFSEEELLAQARAWGFVCDADSLGNPRISPTDGNNWVLQRRSDPSELGKTNRWLLLVDGVPQISFYPEDVMRFLERRRTKG